MGGPVEGSSLVEVRDLSKVFESDGGEVRALDHVSLAVEEGQFVSLVGPSGCGKSTLLNVIGGLLAPTAGSVAVRGAPVTGPPREVGMMFQSPVLLEWRTARDNVLLPLELSRGRRTAARHRERADALLQFVGLGGFEDHYPRQLSGGMQQRVAICRMLIAEPALLLMDEPFGALDEFTREYMNVELSRIVTSSGDGAVFVTHDIQEAVFLSDRVCVMSARPGRIVGLIDIDLPRPRTSELFTSPELVAYVREVRSKLELGVDAQASA
jgi:NitT/TauT family transport system ATP-binding protein